MKHTPWISLPLATVGCLIPWSTQAQVTPDGTTSTTVNQNGNNFVINEGDRIGDNLFHSFDEFSVPTLGSAVFNNAGDIANILSRVTGGNISNIDGTLGAMGTANLYLVNPNGIIFGENARLDLGGSFFASTADSLLFEGDAEFSAVNPQAAPLLEVSIPIGLSFRDNPGDITVQSSSNSPILQREKTIAFIGGNLTFDGANIVVPGSKVELGGLVKSGVINISEEHSLSFPENVTQANISLLNNSRIAVNSFGGGSITVNGENLEITDSSLLAGISPGSDNSPAQAGDIEININEEVSLTNNSIIFNFVANNAVGNAGDLNLTTKSLNISNSIIGSGFLFNEDLGNMRIIANDISLNDESILAGAVNENAIGNAGVVEINARNILIDESNILNGVTIGANGNGGRIEISTDSITLLNSLISNSIDGIGNTEDIKINAQNIVLKNSFVASGVFANGVGDSGDITLNTESLNIVDGSQVTASTFGRGNAGDIEIDADGIVLIAGAGTREVTSSILGLTFDTFPSSVDSQIGVGSEGNGGNINITASNLLVKDGASINTSNLGNGRGGNINLDISENIILERRLPIMVSGLNFNVPSSIQTATGGTFVLGVDGGVAGNINIEANSLILRDSSIITSLTQSQQNAGNISIQTENLVSLNNSAIGNSILFNAEGNAGNINIETQTLNLIDGGQIDSQVNGELFNFSGGIGQGGNIRINATDSVNISGFRTEEPATFNPVNPSQLQLAGLESSGIFVSTQTGATGQAGTITIDTKELNLANSGIIEAFTANSSDGGSIEINANVLNATNGGQIIATTFGDGKAGNVIINSNNEINLSGSDSTFDERSAQRPLAVSNQGADSGIFANTTIDSTGSGGSIFISNPEQLTVEQEAKISVNSLGRGNGGDLFIQTDLLSLNRGQVSASTNSGEGGNITLEIGNDLRLQNDSFISAQAVNDANGGNLAINTDLVIAFSPGNNDIIANASEGRGGAINIDTQAIFGLKERPLNPVTNDINASSEANGLDGTIDINNPAADPTTGLINLPASVGDASNQISQNPCQQGVGSQFIVTGKGGLPSSPTETLNNNRVKVDLVEPLLREGETGRRGEALKDYATHKETREEDLVRKSLPAMGWAFNDNGEVTLTAYSNAGSKRKRSQQYRTTCQSNLAP